MLDPTTNVTHLSFYCDNALVEVQSDAALQLLVYCRSFWNFMVSVTILFHSRYSVQESEQGSDSLSDPLEASNWACWAGESTARMASSHTSLMILGHLYLVAMRIAQPFPTASAAYSMVILRGDANCCFFMAAPSFHWGPPKRSETKLKGYWFPGLNSAGSIHLWAMQCTQTNSNWKRGKLDCEYEWMVRVYDHH